MWRIVTIPLRMRERDLAAIGLAFELLQHLVGDRSGPNGAPPQPVGTQDAHGRRLPSARCGENALE